MLLGDILQRTAVYYPKKTGLVAGEKRFTWPETNRRVNRLGNGLIGLGLQRQERVGILSRNSHQYLEFLVAAAKTGIIAVPLNTEFKGSELLHVIRDSGARALIVHRDFVDTIGTIGAGLADMVMIGVGEPHPYRYDFETLVAGSPDTEPDVEVSEDDLWLLAYTSGTTGKPKGAMMSHRNGVAGAVNDIWTLKIDSSDTYLVSAPFYLNSAGGARYATVMAGATLVIMTYEAESVLRTIEKEKVTRFHGGPTMLARLVNHPDVGRYDLKSVRGIAVTGARLQAALWRRIEEVFGKVCYPIYGLTENIGDGTVLRRDEVAFDGDERLVRRLASVGKPSLLVDVRVVDEKGVPVAPDGQTVGEVILRGQPVTRGYWNDARKTGEVVWDGWLHTGDLATVDEDGYIYIVDRKSDTIKSGGRQIYPGEVEDVILTHPAVLLCAVFRVPDSQWGETPKAIVQLRAGTTATEQEIVELCRKNLASYKKPTSVEFVTDMPMTPSGKILKKALMERYWRDTREESVRPFNREVKNDSGT